MCANPKCRVDSIELGRCERCGQVACYSCGYSSRSRIFHDGAFCVVATADHEISVDSELRRSDGELARQRNKRFGNL